MANSTADRPSATSIPTAAILPLSIFSAVPSTATSTVVAEVERTIRKPLKMKLSQPLSMAWCKSISVLQVLQLTPRQNLLSRQGILRALPTSGMPPSTAATTSTARHSTMSTSISTRRHIPLPMPKAIPPTTATSPSAMSMAAATKPTMLRATASERMSTALLKYRNILITRRPMSLSMDARTPSTKPTAAAMLRLCWATASSSMVAATASSSAAATAPSPRPTSALAVSPSRPRVAAWAGFMSTATSVVSSPAPPRLSVMVAMQTVAMVC